jgi:putative sporulation protein YyaC
MKAPIDSVAPIVGAFLQPLFRNDTKEGRLEIIGNMWEPVHAINFLERTKHISKDDYVLAIDSSIASYNSDKTIGDIIVRHTGIKPGSGVGKTHLPEIGNDSIAIVTAKEPILSLWLDPDMLIKLAHQAALIATEIIVQKLRNPELKELKYFGNMSRGDLKKLKNFFKKTAKKEHSKANHY